MSTINPVEQTMSLERARVLRLQSTDAERRLWRHLRERRLGGVKFRRQVPIGPYVVDFLVAASRLVIEVDAHGSSSGDIGC
jgi:very-short-patch-repair endonuclease